MLELPRKQPIFEMVLCMAFSQGNDSTVVIRINPYSISYADMVNELERLLASPRFPFEEDVSQDGFSTFRRQSMLTKTDITKPSIVHLRNRFGLCLVGQWEREEELSSTEEVALLLHGLACTKNDSFWPDLARSLPMPSFRFDFSGNGESEGRQQFGNLWREYADIHCAVEYIETVAKKKVSVVIGHSQGGSLVLMYAASTALSKSHRPSLYVNISGRLLSPGSIFRFKNNALSQQLMSTGECEWNGTHADMRLVHTRVMMDFVSNVPSITTPVVTIHGSADTIIPLSDAQETDKLITGSHRLIVVEGADHGYKRHRKQLIEAVQESVGLHTSQKGRCQTET
jgi:pimeloyl-ACP methyl ester carboxylesterase